MATEIADLLREHPGITKVLSDFESALIKNDTDEAIRLASKYSKYTSRLSDYKKTVINHVYEDIIGTYKTNG